MLPLSAVWPPQVPMQGRSEMWSLQSTPPYRHLHSKTQTRRGNLTKMPQLQRSPPCLVPQAGLAPVTTVTQPAKPPTNSAWATGPPTWTRKQPTTNTREATITLTPDRLVQLLTRVVRIATSQQDQENTEDLIQEAVRETFCKKTDDWPELPKTARAPAYAPPPKDAPQKKIQLKKEEPKKPPTPPAAETDTDEDIEVSSPPPQQAAKKPKTEANNYPGNPPPKEVIWYRDFYDNFDRLKEQVENSNTYIVEHLVPPRWRKKFCYLEHEG